MPFVKLDTRILRSTLWANHDDTVVFITALLMAEPWYVEDPTSQLNLIDNNTTGFVVPPGDYGFVSGAPSGILRNVPGQIPALSFEAGLAALNRLGSPDPVSGTDDYEGRRLVRVSGGFVVLNFMRYRERDLSSAERARRYRERKKINSSHRDAGDGVTGNVTSHRSVTDADADADVEAEKKDQENGGSRARARDVTDVTNVTPAATVTKE